MSIAKGPRRNIKGRYAKERMTEYKKLKSLVEQYTREGRALPPRLKQKLPKLREMESYLAREGFI